jgi:CheY-like chemotaxis protein
MRAPDDPAIAELRTMMERQVADMTRLLDDLLDVSRIARGRIQVDLRLCDFVAIVRETTDDHRQGFERSGIRLEVELPDHPLWVLGDRTRLAQTVTNLLDNARKFTNTGGTVAVRLTENAAGDETILAVRDTGVGMEPEILEHAFQPFVQADRTIERSRGGLGLGLVLVKGLVELHGGTVAASSEGTGRGSELIVRLPLEPATLPAQAPEDAVQATARPQRILVVEDNPVAAESIEMFLVEHGHTVAVARTGPEGIETARRLRPGVVLCDIGLPELDGYEVARALRSESALGPVYLIAITGYGQETDRRRAREAGFDRHLTKPVDLDELRHILVGLP